MGGGRYLNINVVFLLVDSAIPAMTRRPGASLANPNKAARRVTAVEFASDSDEAGRVFYLRPVAVLVNGGCHFLVFSGKPVSVAVSGLAAVILAFPQMVVPQLLGQGQVEPDIQL